MAFLLGATSIVAYADDLKMGEVMFIKDAAKSNIEEIEFSKLASTKSANPEVKKYAATLVKDHTAAQKELAAIAKKRDVDIEHELTTLQKAKYKLTANKVGKDFDEAYIEDVGIDAHKANIEKFKEAREDTQDPELKKYIESKLPHLEHHLKMAIQIQQKDTPRK
jgi:putative membrane protein